MRHGKKFNHLKRKSAHRKALLRNLSIALITHKRITTTLAKAKALRVHFEPLVTKAKSNTTHSRRVVFSYLQNKEAIKELFGTIADKVGDRPGGYVRIIKLGFRRGDGAEMAMIELVDFNDVYAPNEDSGRSEGGRKRRRRRGGGGGQSKASTTTTAETAEEETEEEDIQEDVIEDAPVDTEDEETTEDTEAEEKDEEEK